VVLMSTQQSSKSVSDQTDPKSEVLSESTALDSLLVAILGEERDTGDDRAQLLATIDTQVGKVVQELGLEDLLAERRRSEAEAVAREASAAVARASAELETPASTPPSSGGSKLRQTFGRLFSSRLSAWLVFVVVIAATLATVSAITRRLDTAPVTAANAVEDAARASAPKVPSQLEPPQSSDAVAAALRPQTVIAPSAGAPSSPRAVTDRQTARVQTVTPPRALPSATRGAAPAPTAVSAPSTVVTNTRPTDSASPVAPSELALPNTSRSTVLESSASAPAVSAPAVVVASERPNSPAEPVAPAPPPASGGPERVVPPATSSPASVATTAIDRRRTPRPLFHRAPEYPAAFRSLGLVGSVEVSFTINPNGRVTNVTALKGPLRLRALAVAAVQQWTYEPATLNDVPVVADMVVQLKFAPPSGGRPEQQQQ